jgi:hypothetical protein
MSLKQKALGIVAGGLTLASLIGSPSYASYKDSKLSSFWDKTVSARGDVNGDGLTDMILGNKNAVMYFKNLGNGGFQYEQLIYSPKKGLKPYEKMSLGLINIGKELELIIITPNEFKIFKVNDKGRFEEADEIQWMEEDESDSDINEPNSMGNSLQRKIIS